MRVRIEKNKKAFSSLFVFFLLFSLSCTESKPPLVQTHTIKKENGEGYAGAFKMPHTMSEFILDSIKDMESTLHNFGAHIEQGVAEFDGSGFSRYWGGNAYLSVDSNPDLDMGLSDFTIETEINFKEIGLYNSILTRWDNPDRNWNLVLMEGPTPLPREKMFWQFWWSTDGRNTRYISCLANAKTNTWYHIAATRNGLNMRLFINGKLCAEALTADSIAGSKQDLVIGRPNRFEAPQLIASQKDIRIIKGKALYIREFPSRSPASPIAGPSFFCKDSPDNCY